MKSSIQVVVVLFLGSFLWSCGSDGPSNGQETPPPTTTVKWKIDEAMMVHLRSPEQVVAAFSSSDGADYSSLADKLQEELNLLTANCTMTGAAHDALHAWLLPYMDLVSKLGEAPDAAASKEVFSEIEAAFKVFDQTFE